MSLMAVGIIIFAYIYNRRQLGHQLEVKQLKIEKNQELIDASFESSEQERKRIAAELHDDINNRLTIMKYGLAGANMPKEVETEVYHQIDDTIERIRQISRNLMPPTVERLGLREALHQLFEDFSSSTGLKYNVNINEELKMSSHQRALGLYRICQELLNNTHKHAEANEVNLRIELHENRLLFRYSDDGVGMDVDRLSGGVGLRSIESRVELLRGDFKWESSPGKGVSLTVNCKI